MSLTRREVLGAAGAALGGALLSACAPAANTTKASESAESSALLSSNLNEDHEYQQHGAALLSSLKSKDEICRTREKQGRVETLEYQTHSYVLEEANPGQEVIVTKKLNVWLPAGYNRELAHSVVYLLHGTGQMQDYWLGDESAFGEACHGAETRGILDGLVEEGLLANAIVVTPTYYSMPEEDIPATTDGFFSEPYADRWPMLFYKELRETIVPLVESTYLTGAHGDTSEESLVNSRARRAFAGLSRGSMATVNSAMMHCSDIFAYFGCFSGVWADFDEFKAHFEDLPEGQPLLYWYNGNGTRDFSLENHQEFCQKALDQLPDTIVNGANFAWVNFNGGDHNYQSWACHLYNALLCFF